jgi:nicotinamidase-related amidase
MTLTIWPEHCTIGSKGHSVVPVINEALQKWAETAGRPINYIMKGQNLRVEMYSALQAEVPDPKDQNTGLNVELLSMLKTSDRVRFAVFRTRSGSSHH